MTTKPFRAAGCHPDRKHKALGLCEPCYRIRSLLCTPCNRGIGFLGDDPKRVLAALHYLESGS